jgi:glucose/arabinose dehydrogenase
MRAVLSAAVVTGALVFAADAAAQTAPSVVDPALEVRPVATGLAQPVQMEFIGEDDFFVLEKATGQVKRVKDGGTPQVVLDLTVNSSSERACSGSRSTATSSSRSRWSSAASRFATSRR